LKLKICTLSKISFAKICKKKFSSLQKFVIQDTINCNSFFGPFASFYVCVFNFIVSTLESVSRHNISFFTSKTTLKHHLIWPLWLKYYLFSSAKIRKEQTVKVSVYSHLKASSFKYASFPMSDEIFMAGTVYCVLHNKYSTYQYLDTDSLG
jgi:hypothetical protein